MLKRCCICLAIIGCASAYADGISLAVPFAVNQIGINGGAIDTPSQFLTTLSPTLSSFESDGPTDTASVTTSIAVDPSVSVSASGTAFAQAFLTYQFEIEGPANANALVDISSILGTATGVPINAGNGNIADLTVIAPGLDVVYLELVACSGGTDCAPSGATFAGEGGAFNNSLLVATNTAIDVKLHATALTNGAFTGSLSASVDPFIQIDPLFASGNPGYSLIISDGIINSPLSGVPEPKATWAVIAALSAIGLLLRRRLSV
jgi:hypothetical protein